MARPGGIAGLDARMKTVPSTEFSQRFSSKQECYRFVSFHCGIYCDSPATFSIHHLRSIVQGQRKTIKSKDVCQVHVPHFDSLSIAHMLEFASNYPEVFQILPEEKREINVLHRQYIANVIFYVAGKEFTNWIEERLKERTEKLLNDRSMNIHMDPEIYEIYKQSNSISGKFLYLIHNLTIFNIVSKGISGHLMKASTVRRKTKAQRQQEQSEEARK